MSVLQTIVDTCISTCFTNKLVNNYNITFMSYNLLFPAFSNLYRTRLHYEGRLKF